MTATDALNTRLGAIWVQPKGPNTPVYYLGCHDLGDISEPAGSIELQRCFDHRTGGWKVVGSTQAPPDAVTTSIENMTFLVRDWLEKLKCEFTLFAFQRSGGEPNIFYNYRRALILQNSRVTNISDKAVAHHDEETPSTQSRDIEAFPPVIRTGKLTARQQVTSETLALNDVTTYSPLDCENRVDPGDKAIAAADASAYTGDVLQTLNAGASWAALAADPFAAGKNIMASIAFPISDTVTRLLVAKQAVAAAQGQVAYSDDNGATWTLVSIGGAAAGHGALNGSCLFALDQGHIWLASANGYIYFSSNGGASWTAQTSGSIVTDDILSITFIDESNGIAGTEADSVLVTSDGGTTWTETGNTGTGGDIITVAGSSPFWWAGTDDGKLFYSRDNGETWTEREFSGSGTGQVKDIAFANTLVGYLIKNTTAPVGKIFVTVNGGYTWNEIETPTNAGLNSLSIADDSTVYAVGEVYGGTAMIIKTTWD